MVGSRSSFVRSFLLAGIVIVPMSAGCQVRVGGQEARDATASQEEDCRHEPFEIERIRCAKRNAWAPKQRAFDAAFADEIAAFRAIEAELSHVDSARPEVVSNAEELRARFVKRCIAESGWSTSACWNGTFARNITLSLAKIRFRQGDKVAAAVEVFTFKYDPDLRSANAKIAKIDGHPCGVMGPAKWCTDPEKELGPLYGLSFSSPEQGVEWRSGHDIESVSKTKDSAVLKFRTQVFGAGTSRSCGDAEWRTDRAGNQVLIKPCETQQYKEQRFTFAPATVPLFEIGDYKVSEETGVLVVYSTKDKHLGHVVETWIDTHQVTDRGRKILKSVLFRGLPVEDAKPQNP